MARKMGLQYTLSYMHIGKRQCRSKRGFLLCGMMAAFACALCLAARAGERERLLGPFREKLHRVVCTKHFDMGGSHYAYTDAVSDEDVLNPGGVKKEFNFKPGSSLCMLSLDEGLNVWETTLLHDDNGVIRDPDVSYDGKRILFAWKKSARDDDYHLYEMDVATRNVRQLTFGKGVADYEGIYLPDGNIMFSSSRSPLVKLLEKGHRGVKMTQEEMDKIACWIDLAVPHSGTWTEGMMADDESVYLRVRKLRDAWQREEAANIAAYLESQKARKGKNP